MRILIRRRSHYDSSNRRLIEYSAQLYWVLLINAQSQHNGRRRRPVILVSNFRRPLLNRIKFYGPSLSDGYNRCNNLWCLVLGNICPSEDNSAAKRQQHELQLLPNKIIGGASNASCSPFFRQRRPTGESSLTDCKVTFNSKILVISPSFWGLCLRPHLNTFVHRIYLFSKNTFCIKLYFWIWLGLSWLCLIFTAPPNETPAPIIFA